MLEYDGVLPSDSLQASAGVCCRVLCGDSYEYGK